MKGHPLTEQDPTDQHPVVPPTPAPILPPPVGEPRPHVPPQPAPHPGYGVPPTYGYVPPPPPRRPAWLIPVIAGAVVLVLGIGALVVGAVVFFTTVSRTAAGNDPVTVAGPPAPPATGDPGSPVAADPLDCVGCFTPRDAARLRLAPLVYLDLGLDYDDGAPYSTTVGEELDLSVDGWQDVGGDPAECFFAFPQSPIAHTPDGRTAEGDDDHLHYPSWHFDETETYWLTEGVRLFDDSDAATAYMAGLETAVDGCDTYSLPDNGWIARLEAAPALDLPASVAAYGWVETGGYNRYYVFDLQRGNLVLRVALGSDGVGPTEAEFRAFAESYADLLGQLEPTG